MKAGLALLIITFRILADGEAFMGETHSTVNSRTNSSFWKDKLTKEQFQIARLGGTEPPFSGAYWNQYGKGVYHCVCCERPLFSWQHKFKSGTGWPSFSDVMRPDAIRLVSDSSHGMVRTEVLCLKCGAHLGHVFKDGPPPTQLRYCINSASMVFKKEEK